MAFGRRRFSPTVAYRCYALLILALIATSNYADRTILSALIGPIKDEFHISDMQMGLMGGFAFGAVYTILGIPIAYLADRRNRTVILTIALTVWSAATVACAFVETPEQLLLARLAVAAGEAGATSPAYSLIADLFSKRWRGTAFTMFALGVPVGSAAGFLAGGIIGAEHGWRTAFLALGIPGFILAAILLMTTREPPRGLSEEAPADIKPESPRRRGSLWDDLRQLISNAPLRHVIIGCTLATLVGMGSSTWAVQFLQRSHGFTLADSTGFIALLTLTSSLLGTLVGGPLSDLLSRRDPRWGIWFIPLAMILALPVAVLAYVSTNTNVTIAALFVPAFVSSLVIAPTITMTQNLVEPEHRALSGALFAFAIYLFGMGGGPLLVGWLSDVLAASQGPDALRVALLAVAFINIGSIIYYIRAGRGLAPDQARGV